jgi:hypothetical protein
MMDRRTAIVRSSVLALAYAVVLGGGLMCVAGQDALRTSEFPHLATASSEPPGPLPEGEGVIARDSEFRGQGSRFLPADADVNASWLAGYEQALSDGSREPRLT